MEGFTFKNLSDIDALDRPTDKTKLVGMENGAPVQIPANGLQESRVLLIDLLDGDWSPDNQYDTDYGDKIKTAMLRGDLVWVHKMFSSLEAYALVSGFYIQQISTGGVYELVLKHEDFGISGAEQTIFRCTV